MNGIKLENGSRVKEEPEDILEFSPSRIKTEFDSSSSSCVTFLMHGSLASRRRTPIKHELKEDPKERQSKFARAVSPLKIVSCEESHIAPEDVKAACRLNNSDQDDAIVKQESIKVEIEPLDECQNRINKNSDLILPKVANKEEGSVYLNSNSSSQSVMVDSQGRLYFECSRCREKFLVLSKLMGHIADHLNKEITLCGGCTKEFKAKNFQRQHSSCNAESYSCLLCGKLMHNFQQVKNHETMHNRINIRCPGCRFRVWFKPFNSRGNSYEAKKFLCRTCKQLFVGMTHYKMHSHLHKCPNLHPIDHKDEETGASCPTPEVIDESVDSGEPLRCPICNARFLSRKWFGNHMAVCRKSIQLESRLHICYNCTELFNSLETFVRHVDKCAQDISVAACPT